MEAIKTAKAVAGGKVPVSTRFLKSYKKHKFLYLIALPGIIWAIAFCYIPIYGLYMAFINYTPKVNFLTSLFQQEFVGLAWFKYFFQTGDFARIMRNTLATSGITLLISFPAPIILAILFTECRSPKFKKFSQTASYLPFFISWVICANIFLSMMSSEGVVNQVLQSIGLIKEPILFFQNGPLFWVILGIANAWKGMGYSAIIYLSAITSIDPEVYDSASIDGANRFQKIRYITLPCIMPTISVMFVLAIGGLLNAGFEQQLLMSNDTIIMYSDVIDTYAYRYGIGSGMYSYSTAVGFFKSIVNFVLVMSANAFVSKIRGRTLV